MCQTYIRACAFRRTKDFLKTFPTTLTAPTQFLSSTSIKVPKISKKYAVKPKKHLQNSMYNLYGRENHMRMSFIILRVCCRIASAWARLLVSVIGVLSSSTRLMSMSILVFLFFSSSLSLSLSLLSSFLFGLKRPELQ